MKINIPSNIATVLTTRANLAALGELLVYAFQENNFSTEDEVSLNIDFGTEDSNPAIYDNDTLEALAYSVMLECQGLTPRNSKGEEID